MYTKFLTGTVPSIRAAVPDIPDDVAQVLDGCLQMDREDRLDSLAPLEEVLERYAAPGVEGGDAGGHTLTELPAPTDEVSTMGAASASVDVTSEVHGGAKPRGWLAVAGLVVAVGAVGAYAAFGTGDATPARGTTPTETSTPTATADATASASASAPRASTTAASSTSAIPTSTASAVTVKTAPVAVRPLPPVRSSSKPATSSEPPPVPSKTTGLAEELPY
jgi:serine/threonine-protein kinase